MPWAAPKGAIASTRTTQTRRKKAGTRDSGCVSGAGRQRILRSIIFPASKILPQRALARKREAFGPVIMKSIAGVRRFAGLDDHAETIAVAAAEKDGEVRSLGIIPNRPQSIRKLLPKLEAECVVIAPTLVPAKS